MKTIKVVAKALVISLMAFALMGAKCKKDEPASNHVRIDPSLKQRCPSLPTLDLTQVTMGDLTVAYKDLQVQYIECAIRNDCLIEAVDSAVEIKCPAIGHIDEQAQPAQKQISP